MIKTVPLDKAAPTGIMQTKGCFGMLARKRWVAQPCGHQLTDRIPPESLATSKEGGE